MKILEVIHGLPSGGAERLVVDLCNEFSKEHDVTLLLLKDLKIPGMDFYLSQVSDRVKVKCLGLQNGIRSINPIKTYRTIKKINPDVVHMHCGYAVNNCTFAMFLDGKNRKYFQTLHNDVEHVKISPSAKYIYPIAGRMKILKFIAISQTNYTDFIKTFPYCECTYINNGRDIQERSCEFANVQLEINRLKKTDDTIVMLNVARCSEQKNHKLLINSINNLVSSGKDIICLIIGNGYHDTELGRELKTMAGENIHFLGTRTNISDYMQVADVVCFSSLFEGMPITAIEAILNGKPIVSTPVCGVVDVVDNNVNGLISEDFTVENFQKMLLDFIDKKAELQRNAIQQMQNSPYTISNCAQKYIEYFQA